MLSKKWMNKFYLFTYRRCGCSDRRKCTTESINTWWERINLKRNICVLIEEILYSSIIFDSFSRNILENFSFFLCTMKNSKRLKFIQLIAQFIFKIYCINLFKFFYLIYLNCIFIFFVLFIFEFLINSYMNTINLDIYEEDRGKDRGIISS